MYKWITYFNHWKSHLFSEEPILGYVPKNDEKK